MALGFQDKQHLERSFFVTLLRGLSPDQTPCYVYLAIKAADWAKILLAQEEGAPINPLDYGTVIASGAGEPDEETRQRMREQYGAI